MPAFMVCAVIPRMQKLLFSVCLLLLLLLFLFFYKNF